MVFPHLNTITPFEDNVTDVLAEDQIHHAIFGNLQVSTLPIQISGTATVGSSLQVLIDSGATFVSSGVVIGDVIYNSYDTSYGIVKSVDSETQLTTTPLVGGASNVWASTDTYSIRCVPRMQVSLISEDGLNQQGIYVRNSANNAWTYIGAFSGNHLKFLTSPVSVPSAEGVFSWNTTEKALNMQSGLGPIAQIPYEFWALVYNDTASTINNKEVVRIFGSFGDFSTIRLANASSEATANATLGMATMDIPPSTYGIITKMGKVRGIDTSSFAVNSTVWLSTVDGGLTTTQPQAPNWAVHVGHVVVSHATNGIIDVDIDVVTQNADSVHIDAGAGVVEMNNVQDFFRHSWSTGITDGGIPSSDGAGGLNITSGEAIIRDADADDADMKAYVLPAATSLALTNNDVNYVYYTLSAGVLVWNVTTDPTVFDGITKVISYIVSRNGTALSIVNLSKINVDTGRKQRRQTFEWDGRVFNGAFGSILGQPSLANAGTRNVTCTASKNFVMNNPISSGAFDTTVAGASTFNNYSRFTNRSAWVRTDGQKQIDNTQYDNAGTLTTMTNNNWRRDDWYLILCTTTPVLCKVMGNNESNSQAGAVAFGPPASLPPWFDGQGIVMYLGYSTIQKSASTATFVNFRGQASTTSSGVTSHSALTPSSLSWTTSAHTSTANTLATFGTTGEATAITLTAGQSVRMNAGATALEAYTPSVGGNTTDNIGYLNIPQNSQSAAYTGVLADSGKHIYHPSADTTARTWTIPANSSVAYPIGTAITFINDTSGGVITIAITSDTMILAGAGTTGSRTLAANGIATAVKITSTRWIISGTGLT